MRVVVGEPPRAAQDVPLYVTIVPPSPAAQQLLADVQLRLRRFWAVAVVLAQVAPLLVLTKATPASPTATHVVAVGHVASRTLVVAPVDSRVVVAQPFNVLA